MTIMTEHITEGPFTWKSPGPLPGGSQMRYCKFFLRIIARFLSDTADFRVSSAPPAGSALQFIDTSPEFFGVVRAHAFGALCMQTSHLVVQ
jgi:hypothetical protein